MSDHLELAVLHRSGGGSPAKKERYTFDFVVNGQSLFAVTGAASFDLAGCLSVPQREPELSLRFNDELAQRLTAVPIGGSYRVALYVCPECGDLACGAITALVSRSDGVVHWSEFAHENGDDSEAKISTVGPFAFDWTSYVAEIERACAAR
ncbi:hypothetical protein C7U92_29690 [Bradyrhizobium sp. WBOS7]|uniref:Uncharacterized protein n=1 Tax=Bradyrhizobium betae TaxID=244734 RepID=A0AAE9SPQ2_9BRAD|nr:MULTISPECIES: hypothetical protein [Bradyrhizobium]MDD1574755.1 hypothetical protein [Bradyrhizobium sp. WBOS1]UUO35392.1 hypothetical protein DCK84_12990 [Bradyrhizobium sp. WBOS01]MDD1531420.1 hypothetical protein [Bradyrhizobium sp. WBOS2]MDD1580861.1 hypothetical protein [Bradyrhizobium sp. WBOS7]MDD1604364.1 hypothetical protein [Bradyrhizobium sp. WBOS16]